MPGKKQKDWRSFKDARKYARSLGLQSRCEWIKFIDGQYSGLGRKPVDIPDNPVDVYKVEWKGWENWMGSGNNMPVKENKAPLEKIRRKKLKPKKLKQKKLKPEKPRCLDRIRKIADSEEYQSQLTTTQNDFCSFEEARKYARELDLKSHYEWTRFVCTHLKTLPPNIPLNPDLVYRFEWTGWADWLGVLAITPSE